jgi:prepilin-type N-terminal cleavage/methylation domain-containing protein
MKKKGLTIMELLVVVAIVGIVSALFYSVFYLNWFSFDRCVTRINLCEEARIIADRVSFQVRSAKDINLVNNKSVVLEFVDGSSTTYTITDSGQFQVTDAGNSFVLSSKVDFQVSYFRLDFSALVFYLVLKDEVFGKPIEVKTVVEVMPRN